MTTRSSTRRRSPLMRGIVGALTSFVLVAGGFAPAAFAEPGDTTVTNLVTNHNPTPLGVDGQGVRFGWQLESSARGVMQEAYQIEVRDADGGKVWDSGKKESTESNAIAYEGPELQSQSRYTWRVKVWDSTNPDGAWSEETWFETGILDTQEWEAEWIGGIDPQSRLEEWTDYTVELDYTLKEGTAFGVFLRAQGTNDAFMWQLNDETEDTPMFRPHNRVQGGYSLIEEIDLRDQGLDADVLKEPGTMRITVEGDTITTEVNDTEVHTYTSSDHPYGVVGIRTSESSTAMESVVIHSLKVTTPDDDVLLDTTFQGDNPFNGGELVEDGLKLEGSHDVLVSVPEPTPLLRKEFTTSGEIDQARLYASARGVYSMELNGQKVSEDKLAPGWTDYDTRIQHQTYDVTELLTDGTNTLGGILASGWYTGTLAHIGDKNYGDRTSLIAQLRIDYKDGTNEVITSDDTWTTADGPWQHADIINGETYDARAEQQGWSTPEFNDSTWQDVWVASEGTDELTPQIDPPVRQTEELPALERSEPTPGAWVYDLGQNMVGVAKFTLTGEKDQTVKIRYGEEINSDGTLYTENLRKAKATDYYTFADDGTVEYEPEFTFHGFRYIEISGTDTPPEVDEVTGLVWNSDLPFIGSLSTSSAMLNQLQSNIQWGQRGNFLSIPTDTPARDERMGWSGDINVFAPTAAYNMHSMTFLSKWLTDLQDAQQSNGDYWGVAPYHPNLGCCNGGTGWSDAGITVPWALWQAYGDTTHIQDGWESMTAFMDFLHDSYPDGVRDAGPYGDWLNLDDGVPGDLLGTAYYAYVADLMSQMADAIGESSDAQHYEDLAQSITDVFVEKYVAEDGTVQGNSQTGYALALGMGLVPEDLRDKATEKFVDTVADRDYHLATGFLGTPWLVPALADNGRLDVAYQLLMNETYPSWGYEVSMGATTMWERWNSIEPDGSFGDVGMNSFNHYAYGAIGDWMYKNVGGIAPGAPGYKHAVIAPKVGGGLTQASGSFDSVYGTITTDWSQEDDDFHLEVTIPANTTASVVLPTHMPGAITESGAELPDSEGITVGEVTQEDVTLEVGSGTYEFVVHADREATSEVLEALENFEATITDQEDQGTISPQEASDLLAYTQTMIDSAQGAVESTGEEALTHLGQVQEELTHTDTYLEDLDGPTPLVEAAFKVRAAAGKAVATHLRLSVVPSMASPLILPGSQADVSITVKNRGDEPLADAELSATTNHNWEFVGDAHQAGTIEDEHTGEATLEVPEDVETGTNQTILGLVDFTYQGLTLQAAGSTKTQVDSPISMGEAVVDPDPVGADSVVTVKLPATNDGDIPVTVEAEVDSPFSDDTTFTSLPVTVNPGETVEIPVSFAVPVTMTEFAYEVDTRLMGGDVVFDDGDATVNVELTKAQTDHVDFQDSTSRSDHEAQVDEGTAYEAELQVPQAPFILRVMEDQEADQPQEYTVKANGQVIHQREHTPQSSGYEAYEIEVDDLDVGDDGIITLELEATDGDGHVVVTDVWAYTDNVMDHVDLGHDPSETTHNLDAAPSSGTEPREAGLTRRYSGIHDPGSWYEFDLKINEGEPFILLARETFDKAQQKQFSVIINGEEVQFRDIARKETSEGTRLYQILVDDPELLDGDSVRVRMQKSDTGSEYHDPSHADVWALAPGADTTAPNVNAFLSAPVPAHNDWYRTGPVEVSLQAVDNRPGEVTIEFSTDGQNWQTYQDTLAFSDDGEYRVFFRATDEAGNTSEEDSVAFGIDTTPPDLDYEVTKERKVKAEATDATSGVDRIEYRLGDDEDWQTYSEPVEVPDAITEVQLRAFDEAGNPSEVVFVDVPAGSDDDDTPGGDGQDGGSSPGDGGQTPGDGGSQPGAGSDTGQDQGTGDGQDQPGESDETETLPGEGDRSGDGALSTTGVAVGAAVVVAAVLLVAGGALLRLRGRRA